MKKPKNIVAKLVFLGLSFIIGVALSMQLKIYNAQSGSSISGTAAHLQLELTNIREQKQKTEREIAELEEKIKLLKDSQTQSDELYQNLQKEIEQYELYAGLTKASGEGVSIEFATDTIEQYELLMANFDLILSVINKLNAAGAEGIAINEERVVFSTDLRYEQGNLLVNDVPVGKPIKIYAIGNPQTLEATLNMKYGILWEIRNNFGISVKIEQSDEIVLPMYTQEIRFDFAQIRE